MSNEMLDAIAKRLAEALNLKETHEYILIRTELDMAYAHGKADAAKELRKWI